MNNIVERDASGRELIRMAAGADGWSYVAHGIEFKTSQLDSLFSQDFLGAADSALSIKLCDIDDNEITTQASADTDCVKTIITFSPEYDYEIVSGNIHQKISPSSNVRLWTIGGAIELGAAGTKEFVSSLNLYFMGADEQIVTDGRAAKYMKKTTEGVPYDTNQLQFILRHDVGVKHEIMIVVEYFRE